MNAAAELFRYKGYAGSSMRDLADKVGLEVSSLYSHIKSKEEILITICFQCANIYSEGLSKINDLESDAIQKIDDIIDLHINVAIDYPSSITVFNDEWKHLPLKDLTKFLKIRKEYEKKIRAIIKEGIACNLLKNHPVDIVLNTLLSSMRWIHYSNQKFSSSDRSDLQRIIKNMLRVGLEVR